MFLTLGVGCPSSPPFSNIRCPHRYSFCFYVSSGIYLLHRFCLFYCRSSLSLLWLLLFCLSLSYRFLFGDLHFLSPEPSFLYRPFHMSGRGPRGCRGRGFYLSRSCSRLIAYSRFPSPLMGSVVLGTTQNAYLELSDAISNVFHRSQRYSRKATTLGSVKMAIDGLSDPVVNLFLFFVLILFLLCSFF